MSAISHGLFLLLCLFAGYGAAALAVDLCRRGWRGLQTWAERRVEKRLKREDARVKKFLRHAPSGRIGLCTSSGLAKYRWLGWLRTAEKLELVMCPGCVKGILAPMPMCMLAMMGAKMSGHVEMLDSRDVVAALPSEIEAFRAAMENSHGESEP